jgi:large subunit ribosomal protein L3
VKAILGEKLGMTQVFDEDARAVPVTVIRAGPCRVVQIKRPETDGYGAIQIAYREAKPARVTKPMRGHYDRAGVPPHRHLVEIRVDDPDEYQVGQEINVADVLEKGGLADVAGVSRGKGFQGVMKRHNFSGQGASHGAHKVHRAPGSIGAAATPSRVFRGMKLPGRMGGERTTILNLEVVEVDADRGLLMLRGAVPGAKGAVVLVRRAVKDGG